MPCHAGFTKASTLRLVARMRIESEGLVAAVRAHGEHGAIVRVLTAEHGLLAGYVRGGRSRALRPVLSPGNVVRAELRSRVETQLAAMTVELVQSRAPLLGEPLAAAAIEWTTALAATTLPEGPVYPRIHAALDGVLLAVESASSARQWAGALIGYEDVVLAELGYGIDENKSADALDALRRNGTRIADNLLTDRRAKVLDARERLVTRLARALG